MKGACSGCGAGCRPVSLVRHTEMAGRVSRGKARPGSGKSVTVVTVANSDSLRYLDAMEKQ